MNCKLNSGCIQNSIYFNHAFHRSLLTRQTAKRTLDFCQGLKGNSGSCDSEIVISSVVFNSSCFLVRFNYEVLSIHIYFYNLFNGITVKWIRNICFKDIETSTLVEKFMLIYQNLGWCTHIIHPRPLAALNLLLERILKEIFEMCFYFHDMMIWIWNNLFLLINIAEEHHYYFCCYQFYIYWCAISSCQVTFFASALLRCYINT